MTASLGKRIRRRPATRPTGTATFTRTRQSVYPQVGPSSFISVETLFCCSNVTGGEQGSGPLSKAFSSSCILYISLQRLLIGPRRRWRASKSEKAFFRHLEVAHRPLVSAICCRLRKSRSTCRHRRRRGVNLVLRGTCPCLLSHLWTMRSAIILPNFRRGRPRRCRSPPLLRNRH